MNPSDSPERYDCIILGTSKSPGVVTISGHDRNEAWDIKDAKGQDGASSSLNGKPIAQFQCSFQLVVDYESGVDELEEWEAFKRVVKSTTGGPKPVALPIYHPDLASQDITEVCNGSIGGLKHDGKGGAIVIVKFNEHRPPKPKPPARAQVRGGSPVVPLIPNGIGTAGTPKPDPNAQAKDELAKLLAEAKRP